ncbi:pyrroline-5-carboxylate reductase [Balneola vulgaris]|jgi:pyrroline-5-carboxylate reductase|uniref:pyrroline-5-carboxylate reductase n=1 Tax=Balneola vulgaris TaxID=287535 RepID=UPI00038077CC|nr:pyrroline-5-carboxylate reductase [Balneola vulgaris]
MKVLMIGAGNMGLTFAEGMTGSTQIKPGDLLIYDKDPELRDTLREDERFNIFDSLTPAVEMAHVIFLAVKPHHAESLLAEMKPHLNDQQIIVSLMAGVTTDFMVKLSGIPKVVRAMPNLPAKVSKGVTAFTETEAVSKIEQVAIRDLLDSTGIAIHVQDESFINKSTGISGSGPAYVFYFMQSMMEAALKMGFSQNDSKILVSNTFEGAIQLFKESELAPDGWIKRVASKGGTTQAALDSMDDNNVNTLIKDAAYAAFDRAVELGQEHQ